MKTHTHRAIKELNREKGFSGSAPGARRSVPQAHGWVALHQECRCGARRVINANQGCREVGAWIGKDDMIHGG